jgi:hypothetical protein
MISNMTEANPVTDFSDADLQAAMKRVIRMTVAMAIFIFGVLAFVTGWRSGALFLAGAAVSATGIYEWQELISLVNARLDNRKAPRATGFVLTMFFLRLCVALAIIYVSLKCFNGSPYALVAGLGLAVISLIIEALRRLRS